ncbi:MAG: hypothetical protein ACEY26_00740 [Candidatus Hodgkinia cicadicola]
MSSSHMTVGRCCRGNMHNDPLTADVSVKLNSAAKLHDVSLL